MPPLARWILAERNTSTKVDIPPIFAYEYCLVKEQN